MPPETMIEGTRSGDASAWQARRGIVWAVTVIVYLLLGAAGLSFAIAPGYASPIFPAAGFAVAMVLWAGRSAWVGIWVGSFALNLAASWMRGDFGSVSALLSAGIATGAALQALAARALIVRGPGAGWRTMEHERDIFRCLALGGPAACLVSASVGAAVLSAAGIVKDADFLYSWWNWWSGDTLGVLVVLPLSFIALFWRRPPWRARRAALGVPMLVALSLVACAFVAASHLEREQHKAVIRSHGEKLAQLLVQRFIAHQEALSALQRLVEVTPDMSYAQFENFTRITLADNPDIFALSVNPFVPQAQRQAFERTMGDRTGVAGFQIKERDSKGNLVRAADRPGYVPVGFISPLAGNRPAIGYDIYSEPIRQDAIDRARQSASAAVTAPIQLVQENNKRPGVLLMHPAYLTGNAASAASGERTLSGFAVGVIKVDEMIDISTRNSVVPGLVFQVEDAAAREGVSLLYRSSGADTSKNTQYGWQVRLPMADRAWLLRVLPTDEFLLRQPHWVSLAIGAGGLALASLLQMLLLVTTGRTAVVQRKVLDQTAELQANSSALEDRNTQLDALLRLSPDGFVAFAMDGSVKFVNPAFLSMIGIDSEAVVGKSQAVLDVVLKSRCERPDDFAGVNQYFGDGDGDGDDGTGSNGSNGNGPPQRRILTLNLPRHTVLSVVGMHSESQNLPRILYLHDLTREAEVDRMKSEFLAHAAHELRTPMTSILGYSELLLALDIDEATRKECLEVIHRQTVWLVDIINELLDLSRIEARRGQDLKMEPVDMAALLRDLPLEYSQDTERWPMTVVLPQRVCNVRADRSKVRQTLGNVISNATKYSPEGGGVRIEILEERDRIGVSVSDHGVGMSAEQLEHFGERFWRADTTGKTPGSGLGIAIARELLKLMGGSMEVRSQPGVGTTVTVWLRRDSEQASTLMVKDEGGLQA